MGNNNAMIRVFISHVASESEIAIWIKKEIGGLLKGAIQFFVSSDGEHIVGGDKWLDKILTELKKSHTVLVLCSEESVHRRSQTQGHTESRLHELPPRRKSISPLRVTGRLEVPFQQVPRILPQNRFQSTTRRTLRSAPFWENLTTDHSSVISFLI